MSPAENLPPELQSLLEQRQQADRRRRERRAEEGDPPEGVTDRRNDERRAEPRRSTDRPVQQNQVPGQDTTCPNCHRTIYVVQTQATFHCPQCGQLFQLSSDR